MTDEELENTLVEAFCKRNDWEVGDNEDYDNAVKDVKWFLAAAKPAIEEQERQRLCDEVERYFSLLKDMEPPVIINHFLDTKIWWQGVKKGLTSEKVLSNLHELGY